MDHHGDTVPDRIPHRHTDEAKRIVAGMAGSYVDNALPLTSAGANYGLHAPARDVTRPIGEWNDLQLRVQGGQVEHWLNGERMVVYTLGSPDWEQRVAASKFAAMPQYGRAGRGHIALQDHGDRVWYRDLWIRALAQPLIGTRQ